MCVFATAFGLILVNTCLGLERNITCLGLERNIIAVSRERAGDKYYWQDFSGYCELRNCSEVTPALVGNGTCVSAWALRQQCELASTVWWCKLIHCGID